MLLLIYFIVFLEYTVITHSAPIEVDRQLTDVKLSVNKEYELQYYVQANWYNSLLFCLSNGMRLATINSQEEQDYLEELIADNGLTTTHFWISGSDLADEGRFSWYPIGQLFKYTNWFSGEPNNRDNNEHCVHLQNNQKWNDASCKETKSIICERIQV